MKSTVVAVVAGIALGQLGWIDAIYVPLVLLGPLVTGFVAGVRAVSARLPVLAWFVAGLTMLVGDWVANGEDRLFHLVLAAVIAGISSLGWLGGRALGRRPGARAADA